MDVITYPLPAGAPKMRTAIVQKISTVTEYISFILIPDIPLPELSNSGTASNHNLFITQIIIITCGLALSTANRSSSFI